MPKSATSHEYAQRHSICGVDLTACGEDRLGNVETISDLKSCGGCSTSPSLSLGSPLGIDCNAISGVSEVACEKGSCLVNRCYAGYTVSENKSTCLRIAGLEPSFDNGDQNPFCGSVCIRSWKSIHRSKVKDTIGRQNVGSPMGYTGMTNQSPFFMIIIGPNAVDLNHARLNKHVLVTHILPYLVLKWGSEDMFWVKAL
ncbi:hypothetical protein BXZ70DRAFT_904450 [Cristinia sonorae]|uniref:Protein CPL1-like domain-containing protein n=1 Tax=Cristinia sonorae TaxID=1940300 RepID=A0A8K0XTC7_9AGAR|nr:hypothetical protein BXZ70DRAFT_904450 [Cristinia sonorae]